MSFTLHDLGPMISASQWGSPLAPRRALLIHGLAMCSNTWESVARLLVAEGFFVVAPNLLGHIWRQSSDYRMSAVAEDLRPYFAMDMTYDVIIGHSFGGAVLSTLLPFLPRTKETDVIFVDPVFELSEQRVELDRNIFLRNAARAKSADDCMEEHPAWSRADCVSMALGISGCASAAIRDVFECNKPWSFGSLLKNAPSNVKITVLLGDPKFPHVCLFEDVPADIKNMDVRVILDVGHSIQYDRPDAILDAISLPRAKL